MMVNAAAQILEDKDFTEGLWRTAASVLGDVGANETVLFTGIANAVLRKEQDVNLFHWDRNEYD